MWSRIFYLPSQMEFLDPASPFCFGKQNKAPACKSERKVCRHFAPPQASENPDMCQGFLLVAGAGFAPAIFRL